MTSTRWRAGIALALGGAAWPSLVMAQTTMDEQATPTVQAAADAQGTNSELMAMTRSSLGSEILRRYDAAVAMTRDQGVVAANDTRYIWASEAKAQCGIALGFLKSGTRNPVSIGKCDQAFEWMQRPPAPAPLPSLPQVSTVTPEVCRQPVAGTVFFDWNNAVPSPDAAQTISFIANNMQPCGWSRLTITGHADRSGSEQYNDGLSVRRANAVSGMLTRAGVNGAALVVSGQGESEPRVPTPDGVRNPQNRRVEITVK